MYKRTLRQQPSPFKCRFCVHSHAHVPRRQSTGVATAAMTTKVVAADLSAVRCSLYRVIFCKLLSFCTKTPPWHVIRERERSNVRILIIRTYLYRTKFHKTIADLSSLLMTYIHIYDRNIFGIKHCTTTCRYSIPPSYRRL